MHENNSNVVDVYVNYLRNKIDKDFSPKLIHTITGMDMYLKRAKMKIKTKLSLLFTFTIALFLIGLNLFIYSISKILCIK